MRLEPEIPGGALVRARVAALTPGLWFRARLAAPLLTPARAATSDNVGVSAMDAFLIAVLLPAPGV